MILSGINNRNIYKQGENFLFDFNISNYNSNNFSIGLSGNSFFGLHFISGLIYDWQNNLVSTYNGQPVSFDGSRRDVYLEYSINNIPISRNLLSSSVFERILVNIYDSGNVDVVTNLYGAVPSISFPTVFSTSGVSGQIINHGAYPIELFNISSNDFTGVWTYDSTIQSNQTGSFSISDPSTIISGGILDLSLFANYGNSNHQLSVDSIVPGSGDTEAYSFASLALVSGNNRIVGSGQDSIYAVSYLSSPNYLNLYFDYTQNRTGDARVTRSGTITGAYSG